MVQVIELIYATIFGESVNSRFSVALCGLVRCMHFFPSQLICCIKAALLIQQHKSCLQFDDEVQALYHKMFRILINKK